MSTILTTVLITAPLAFLVGWLLSRLGESLGVSQKLIVKNNWSKQAQQLLGIDANVDAATQHAIAAVPA